MKTLAALLFIFSTAVSAEGINQPIKISDPLSTEITRNLQDRISIRSAGVITEDGEVVLRIIADMPEAERNDAVSTPAAAIGNTQLACDVEDVTGFFPDTRLFTCDPSDVNRGLQNRVCVGYEEAFQFGLDRDLTVYDENRCMDFFAL